LVKEKRRTLVMKDNCPMHGKVRYIPSKIAGAALCEICLIRGYYRHDIAEELKDQIRMPENVTVTCDKCGITFITSCKDVDTITHCPHGCKTVVKGRRTHEVPQTPLDSA
jgi:hypothetical protein